MSAPPVLVLPRLGPPTPLPPHALVAGVDIGGTNQSVAVARSDGEVLARRRCRLRPGGTAHDVLENVYAALDEALAAARQAAPEAGPLVRVGAGFGGPVDPQAGIVLASHHVEGWHGFPLRAALEARLGVPAVLDNDANVGALGEAVFGAGWGARHVLYVNVGTGIGAGLVLDGRLYRGSHGLAGEIGHVTVEPGGAACACGKRGCLEAYASGRSIGRLAREAAAADPAAAHCLVALAGGDAASIEAPQVLAAAGQGDRLANRIVVAAAHYLGVALANAANLLDPDVIVVGGGLSETGDLFFGPLGDAAREHTVPGAPPPRIVPAALGYDAGVAGALALALQGP